MLKTAPDIRPGARAVLELPLAGMADYPGTLAVIERYGKPVVASGKAALVEVLEASGRRPELVAASARVMVNGIAAVVVLGDGPESPIEATLLPLSGTQVLALLRPLDFEKALWRSLVGSRQRYKDLIEIVSDFTWETDDEGRFTFISPLGALDWPASELVGRPVAEFLADAEEMPEPPPVFRARTATEDADVWFRRADGTSDCLSVAAVPLVDAAGIWRGARDVCRKVTDQRRRERDAAHGHLRDRLVTHLSRTIGDELDPQSALAAAASATGCDRRDFDTETTREVATTVMRRLAEEGEGAAERGEASDPAAANLARAEGLHAAGKLDDAAVAAAVRSERGFAKAALAVLAKLSPDDVDKVLAAHSAKGVVALACTPDCRCTPQPSCRQRWHISRPRPLSARVRTAPIR